MSVSLGTPAPDDTVSPRDAITGGLVSFLGGKAQPLVPRFVAAGICTGEALETFVDWTAQEQRTFLKEDMGLNPYEAMDIVHRIARRKQ